MKKLRNNSALKVKRAVLHKSCAVSNANFSGMHGYKVKMGTMSEYLNSARQVYLVLIHALKLPCIRKPPLNAHDLHPALIEVRDEWLQLLEELAECAVPGFGGRVVPQGRQEQHRGDISLAQLGGLVQAGQALLLFQAGLH